MVGPPKRSAIGTYRAHGEHVAQYAADPGRRALVGARCDSGGCGFHLEDRSLAPALARPDRG